MTDFSVIIPTHNRNNFLIRAVKSALSQKTKPLEILVIDDCNNRETESIIKNFSQKKKNVLLKYIKNNQKNNALISRNIGAKHAKGKFLAFLDDDDFWHHNYLYDAFRIIKKKKVEIIVYNTLSFFHNKKIKNNKKIPKVFNIDDYLHYNPGVLCSNIIIHKNTFLKFGGYDLKVFGSADKDLFIQFALMRKKYFISNKKYVYLQNHPDQWSKKHKLILFQKILFFKKYLKYYLDLRNFYKFLKVVITFIIIIIKKNEN